METERKYLLKNHPNLSGARCVRVEQHYIFLCEQGEVRIRKKGDGYFITVKSGGMLQREEWESEIPQESYETLLPAAMGRTVIKDRHEIDLSGGNVAELDIYRDSLDGPGHATVEVEFNSKAEADVFIKPEWFGEDITNDARYKNRSLAENGWPK